MCRVERDVVARPAPEKSRTGQQVVYLEAALGRQAQCCEVQLQPTRLSVVGIEVDDGEHGVPHGRAGVSAAVSLAGLAVGDEILIVDVMELQTPVALQGGVFATDAIEQCNQPTQALGPVAIPEARLVLLRVQVLLTAGLA